MNIVISTFHLSNFILLFSITHGQRHRPLACSSTVNALTSQLHNKYYAFVVFPFASANQQ